VKNITFSDKTYSRIEKLIFICFLVFNLFNIWIPDVYITVDGPAHLYNSALLNQIKGNDLLNSFYSLNTWYVPNYASHIILSKLFLFLDPLVAEKVFLSFIVLLLPVSFRYAVNLLSGKPNVFSFLIFPLIFSQLFHFGFFNFSLAFIFLNMQVALTHLFCRNKSIVLISLLTVNSILLFYTHGFIFAIAGLISVLQISLHFRTKISDLFKNLFYALLVFSPSLILFAFFMINLDVGDYGYDSTTHQKWSLLVNFSPGIVAGFEHEMQYTFVISFLLVFLASYVITLRMKENNEKVNRNDVFLFLSLSSVCAVFLATDGMLGGMFIFRLVYLAFYFFVFWLCISLKNSKFMLIFSFIIVTYSYINLFSTRNNMVAGMSHHAREVMAAADFVEDNSVVYSLDYTGSWYLPHMSNYLGLTKKIVITKNYEAALGWFPLTWKTKINNVKLEQDSAGKNILPDYVFICGTQQVIDAPENNIVKTFLEKETVKLFESQNKICHLYKLKRKNIAVK